MADILPFSPKTSKAAEPSKPAPAPEKATQTPPHRHRQIVKAGEINAQVAFPEPAVWDMCLYLRKSTEPCQECPRFEEDARLGAVQKLCFGLAHEACQLAAAWGKRGGT